nr:YdaS family helix-turn-helix protein [Methylobacterium indicum]
MTDRDPALKAALKNVGCAVVLARSMGISPQAISQWRRCPALRVLAVEQLSGVPRHKLRPDLYPPPVASLLTPHQLEGVAP